MYFINWYDPQDGNSVVSEWEIIPELRDHVLKLAGIPEKGKPIPITGNILTEIASMMGFHVNRNFNYFLEIPELFVWGKNGP